MTERWLRTFLNNELRHHRWVALRLKSITRILMTSATSPPTLARTTPMPVMLNRIEVDALLERTQAVILGLDRKGGFHAKKRLASQRALRSARAKLQSALDAEGPSSATRAPWATKRRPEAVRQREK